MARRPEFNRDEVLKAGTEVLWRRGYASTSVRDLSRATGLQPGSFYAAFGSKEGFFLEALDHYSRASLERIDRVFQSTDDPSARFSEFLLALVDSGSVSGSRGCLMINSLVLCPPEEQRIHADVQQRIGKIEEQFRAYLLRCRKAGTLPPHRDPDALAKSMLLVLFGLRTMEKLRRPAAEIRQCVQQQITAAFADPR